MARPSVFQAGGAFNPAADYEVTGQWSFIGPTFLPNQCDAAGVTRQAFGTPAKAISDAVATPLADVACPAGTTAGGLLFYLVQASDGTNVQALTGFVTYAVANKAGTVSVAIADAVVNQAKALSSGTLTLLWTMGPGVNKATIALQPTGSLTETSFTVATTLFPMAGVVTPL